MDVHKICVSIGNISYMTWNREMSIWTRLKHSRGVGPSHSVFSTKMAKVQFSISYKLQLPYIYERMTQSKRIGFREIRRDWQAKRRTVQGVRVSICNARWRPHAFHMDMTCTRREIGAPNTCQTDMLWTGRAREREVYTAINPNTFQYMKERRKKKRCSTLIQRIILFMGVKTNSFWT
jgi:hypothetical protein